MHNTLPKTSNYSTYKEGNKPWQNRDAPRSHPIPVEHVRDLLCPQPLQPLEVGERGLHESAHLKNLALQDHTTGLSEPVDKVEKGWVQAGTEFKPIYHLRENILRGGTNRGEPLESLSRFGSKL